MLCTIVISVLSAEGFFYRDVVEDATPAFARFSRQPTDWP
jgi:hypothetical protein